MSTTAIELKSYPSPISEDNAEIRSNSVELEALFAKRAGKPKPLRAIDRFTDHVARNEEGYAISMLSLPMISVIPMTLTGDLTTILLVAVGLPAAIFGALVGSLVHTHRSKKSIRIVLNKIERVAGRIGQDVDSWLGERYGFRFASQDDQLWIGKLLVGYRGPDVPLSSPSPGKIGARDLLLESGATVKANFYLTESGDLEIRKTHVKDSTEDPYFATLREELS